ncbi:hypothetical protein [Acetobacterium sp.]|uniref:hypothetical protein n=1 Tax=Acetobacterium sp. TaxID=1872094 RepID=UPI002F42AEE2
MTNERDYEIRNMYNGVDNLEDIYDALSRGAYRDLRLVSYGHGSRYYKSVDDCIIETWANYVALKLTRPDLIKLLEKEKPELVKLMDSMRDDLLKKVGE